MWCWEAQRHLVYARAENATLGSQTHWSNRSRRIFSRFFYILKYCPLCLSPSKTAVPRPQGSLGPFYSCLWEFSSVFLGEIRLSGVSPRLSGLCWISLHTCTSQCQPAHTYQTGWARDYWANMYSVFCDLTHTHTHTHTHTESYSANAQISFSIYLPPPPPCPTNTHLYTQTHCCKMKAGEVESPGIHAVTHLVKHVKQEVCIHTYAPWNTITQCTDISKAWRSCLILCTCVTIWLALTKYSFLIYFLNHLNLYRHLR